MIPARSVRMRVLHQPLTDLSIGCFEVGASSVRASYVNTLTIFLYFTTLILNVSNRVFVQSKFFIIQGKYFTTDECKCMHVMYDMHDPNGSPVEWSYDRSSKCKNEGASSTTYRFEHWMLRGRYF